MNAPRLTLHCGAKQVELDDVLSVDTPEPTRTHVPIPHGWFLEQTKDALAHANLEASDWSYALNHNGQQMFALARVVGDLAGDRDEGVFALRNAHDKVFKASWAYGRRVFVCDNLAFSGEIVVGRKHTPGILDQLPDLLFGAVHHITGMRELMTGKYDAYQETDCDDATADLVICEMVRRRILTDMRQVHTVMAEWATPSHEEFQDHNMWRLFNAGTESLKGDVPNPSRTMRLHALLDEACGFESDETEIIIQ